MAKMMKSAEQSNLTKARKTLHVSLRKLAPESKTVAELKTAARFELAECLAGDNPLTEKQVESLQKMLDTTF